MPNGLNPKRWSLYKIVGKMNVQEIENEIQQLKPEQLKELAVWFDEYRFKLWDERIERDAASGRLDNMMQKALKAHSSRQLREI